MSSRGEDNRQQIVEVANRLFYERGYNQTSFRDIAQATGIPKGNFYYYFKTKDSLLESVVDLRLQHVETLFVEMEGRFERPIDRLKAMAGMVGEMSGDIIRYGCPIGSLSVELGKTDFELKQRVVEVLKKICDWLVRQFGFMGKASKEAEYLALEFLSRLQGVMVMGNSLADETYILNQTQKLAAWVEQQ